MKPHPLPFAVLLCSVLLLGCGDRPKPRRPAVDKLTRFTPVEVVQWYSRNAVDAESNLMGKWLRLDGTIGAIETGNSGQPVLIVSGSDGGEILHVLCEFDKSHAPRIARLSPGKRVSVSCQGAGRNGASPVFIESELIDG